MILWQAVRWILVILWILAGFVGMLLFCMSPMIFDAPGATKDWRNWFALGVFLTLTPTCVVSLVGFAVSLGFQNERSASCFIALPLIPLGGFAIMLLIGK